MTELAGCPFCGAEVVNYEGCIDNAHILSQLLDYNIPEQYLAKFPGVDAMALQHAEKITDWTVFFHVARLKLMFDHDIKWKYEYSPILQEIVSSWKIGRDMEITLPKTGNRGALTSQGLVSLSTAQQAAEYSNNWGKSVYEAYRCDSLLAYPVVSLFLDRIS